MPRPKKGPRLASSPAHERLMLANMATSLFEHGRITTTLPKAKRLRPLAERLITFAKRGDLHSRRRVMRVIRNKSVVHKLFTQIAEQMEQREGGYTRIVKIAPRRGGAPPAAAPVQPHPDAGAPSLPRGGADLSLGRGAGGSPFCGWVCLPPCTSRGVAAGPAVFDNNLCLFIRL